MSTSSRWLTALLLFVLLLAACSPTTADKTEIPATDNTAPEATKTAASETDSTAEEIEVTEAPTQPTEAQAEITTPTQNSADEEDTALVSCQVVPNESLVDEENDWIYGSDNAPVTFMVYSDFQ